MRWKRTRLSVIVAGISGGSSWTNPRRAFGAPIVEWANLLSSSTEILSAYLGRGTSIPKRLRSRSTKDSPFFPEFGTVATWTVVIPNISKSLSLLVK
jgi:hypothetical protein